MQEEINSPLVLVYFKVRGKLQPIRNLCCHLGLSYIQVHMENDDTKKKLPEETKRTLRGLKIEKSLLPVLVHESSVVYETLPIMNYICRKFNAEELMGRDIRQKARVTQLSEQLLNKEPTVVMELFKMAEECLTKSSEDISKEKLVVYEKCIRDSGYIGEICTKLETQAEGRSFIFGSLTLLDFLFLETCHILLGMFNSLNEKKKCALESIFEGLFSCKSRNKNSIRHLKSIDSYVAFMYGQAFYRQNQHFLESFTMVCPSFPPHRVQGLRKIWGFNNNFVV